eukprot:m51a1_g8347 hypothetical protein (235) ;mRNA; f:38355-39256
MSTRITVILAAAVVLASAQYHSRSATGGTAPRIDMFPEPGSDNVVPASSGLATLYSALQNAVVDWTQVRCFAVYNYLPADDYGHLQTTNWGPAILMQQNGREGYQREAQIPVIAGYVLQATSYCVQNGQAIWAPSGNVNFRLAPDQQHPAGELTTFSTVLNAPVNCVARYGYPEHFGGAWPSIHEVAMQTGSGSGLFSGSVELPAVGKLLEVTARCTCGGLQTWLGGNYQITVY